jgi:hypothetical protein
MYDLLSESILSPQRLAPSRLLQATFSEEDDMTKAKTRKGLLNAVYGSVSTVPPSIRLKRRRS